MSHYCFLLINAVTGMGTLVEVCTLSGLSGSRQKVRLRLLVDLMNCRFGQTSALAGFSLFKTFGFSCNTVYPACYHKIPIVLSVCNISS